MKETIIRDEVKKNEKLKFNEFMKLKVSCFPLLCFSQTLTSDKMAKKFCSLTMKNLFR